MYRRRTRQSHEGIVVLCLALLFVFSTVAGGCRDGEITAGPTQSQPFTLSLPVGAQFAYNTWALDQRYPQLPSVKSTTSWRILSTQETYEGMSGVTVIADSASTGKDTLYLAISPADNVYIFGYLARIMERRLGYHLTPRWDLVASFAAGQTGTWTVGLADTLGTDVVYGNFVGASDYYSVSVDGVTEVFPTFRVDLTGQTLYGSIWFSSSPNAVVRLLDEPEYGVNGQLQELALIRSGVR